MSFEQKSVLMAAPYFETKPVEKTLRWHILSQDPDVNGLCQPVLLKIVQKQFNGLLSIAMASITGPEETD